MQQHRHLAAILFTDIVGYTALMQVNEQNAIAVIKHYNAALNKMVKMHGGKVLNNYGDGSLCTFPSATDAINCSMALQDELRFPPEVPLRIGLHIGEIFFEDGKPLGDGVNVASRIQTLGQANTILFSREVFDKIKNHPEFKPMSIGHFDFKNVDERVEVFALANEGLVVPKKEQMTGKLKEIKEKNLIRRNSIIAISILLIGIAAYFIYSKYFNQESYQGERTIAILPFKNISVNKEENEPFCIGIALELQKKLELLGGLIPIAPQSMAKYHDTKLSLLEIASQLGGVKYIVQGNVLRDKDKVKVYVSLSDAATNKELWSDDFPGEVKDIFSLQENIAQQIASALKVKITPDEQSRISRVATKNTAAIDAYNEALTAYVNLAAAIHPLYWDSLSSNPKLYSDYLKTLSLCDDAIRADPSMAEAYVLKGQTYMYRIVSWSAPESERKIISDSARILANKALQIDESSADAYLLLSQCLDPRYSAVSLLEKALAINPNNFDVMRELGHRYAWYDPEKAVPLCKKAIRLNPVSVFTPSVYKDLGWAYHTCGDFEKAEQYGKKAVELANSNSIIAIDALRNLTLIYNHWGKADSVLKYANQYIDREPNALYETAEVYCNLKNNCAKAAEQYAELWRRYPNHSFIHRWAVALMNTGRVQEAKEKIALAIKQFRDFGDTVNYDYAGICALKGDKETALKILQQWKGDWGSPYLIQHDKLFDNIRNEKQFKELVQKAVDEKTRVRERLIKLENE
jgi:adenylate cyclase